MKPTHDWYGAQGIQGSFEARCIKRRSGSKEDYVRKPKKEDAMTADSRLKDVRVKKY